MKAKTELNLKSTPIIDTHCHPFVPVKRRLNLSDVCALLYFEPSDTREAKELERRFTTIPPVVVSRLILELGKLYRGEEWAVSHLPSEAGIILEERYERTQNYSEYVKFLCDDISLKTIIVDTGYPQPPIDLETFSNQVSCGVHYIFRSETLSDQLLTKKEPFSDFLLSWDTAIDEALKDPNCKALKSVIAYRSGLDVYPRSKDEARKSYEAYQQNPTASLREKYKPLLDYLFIRAIEKTIHFDKVLQIHTGMGDIDIIGEKAHPMCLFELLKRAPFSSAKVALVHSGFPWVSEAASMTSLLPDVYMDLSMCCPFYPLGINLRLLEALEQAPIRKILYGSDGMSIVEVMWLGGRLIKESLEEVLGKLIQEKKICKSEGQEMAEMILYKNAEQLYSLSESQNL